MSEKKNTIQSISFITTDHIKLVGDYYAGTIPYGVLLIHMMPATRESWDEFALLMQDHGYHVLAIDLRGHGESTGGPNGFQKFSDDEHQKSNEDVKASIENLIERGAQNIVVVGASIGANLALQALAEDMRVRAAILLSPGINYKGIEALSSVPQIDENKALYVLGAENDLKSSGTSCADVAHKIYSMAPCVKEIEIIEGDAHGSEILSYKPELMDELIDWLRDVI